jgi:hypothetical protein
MPTERSFRSLGIVVTALLTLIVVGADVPTSLAQTGGTLVGLGIKLRCWR